MHRLPVIVVRGARACVHHDYENVYKYRIHPALLVTVFSFLREVYRDEQLIPLPPPRHCPHGTITERPPSAGLGLVMYTRIVCEPGERCDKKRPGWICAGLSSVEGPASSMRMRRSGSAAARRAATTQPVVPPTGSYLGQKKVEQQRDQEGEDGLPPAKMMSYSSLISVGVDIRVPPSC